MSADEFILQVVMDGVAVRTPLFLLYFAALALAGARFRRAPRAMRLVAIGSIVLAVWYLVGPFITIFLLRTAPQVGWVSYPQGVFICQVIETLIPFIGTGLLIAAAFTGRPVPEVAPDRATHEGG